MMNPMSERMIPMPGERYRHFKNKLYQIVAVASHSETGEQMVVYQALYGDFGVWVRPLSMFLEPVDREKYPDTAQVYRFERVDAPCAGGDSTAAAGGREASPAIYGSGSVPAVFGGRGMAAGSTLDTAAPQSADGDPDREAQPDPLLLEFLDCESVEDQLAVLQKMKGKVGQGVIDSLCLCLDSKPSTGSLDEQLDSIRQDLRMQQRYDASRLRRG